jgi:hypothetical protein
MRFPLRTIEMMSFSTVYRLLVEVCAAYNYYSLQYWQIPSQLDLNVGDWEEIRMFFPGAHVGSQYLFGMPVQTWSGLKHGQFRLRMGDEVVYMGYPAGSHIQ